MYADIIIKNGRCLTMREGDEAEWVAVNGRLICALGKGNDWLALKKPDTVVIDAHGNTVLPGFIDSHFHVIQTAINSMGVNLSGARTHAELGEMIATAPRGSTGVVAGCKVEETQFTEKCFPDRNLLDHYCNNAPVVISSKEYHVSMLNTYALMYFKVPITLDGVEIDSHQLPTGIFRGSANVVLRSNILKGLTDKYRSEAVWNLMERLLERGITTVDAMEGGQLYNDEDAEFIHAHAGDYPIDMPMFYQTMDLERPWKLGLRRVGGNIMIDGTIASRSAALSAEYTDKPGWKGRLLLPQQELDEFVLRCYEQDMQLSLYTIGDAAIESALRAHEKAMMKTGNSGLRHRLEHVVLATPSQIARAAELGIIFSVQPTYEYLWGGKGKLYEQRIGDRYRLTNPYRAMLDAGAMACGGSDSDVTEANPLLGIHAAVNRAVEEHGVSVYEAVQMFTANGAYAVFEEKRKGALAPGYLADIVVLDGDILKIPKEKIQELRVVTTIKSGSIFHNEL